MCKSSDQPTTKITIKTYTKSEILNSKTVLMRESSHYVTTHLLFFAKNRESFSSVERSNRAHTDKRCDGD